MTTTATTPETTDSGSPGRRWLDVALDSDLAPDSLSQLAAAATGLLAVVVKHDEAQEQEESDSALVNQLDAELNAALAERDKRQQVIDEILAKIKKSTAKLSNEIRDIVDAAFPVQEEATPGDDPAPDELIEQPPRDAELEVWQAYARAQGIEPDGMNRSQIRTTLGISNGDAG